MFVPYGVTWPSLADFQCQYAGSYGGEPIIFGHSQTFNIQDKGMEGFDLPATRNGDPNRPRQRGQFIGLDLFSGRDLTLTFDVGPSFSGAGYVSLANALSALRSVTNTADVSTGATEYPFFVQFPTLPMLGIMARVRKRSTTIDLAYSLGNMAQGVVVQWHATDPYFYAETHLDTVAAGISSAPGILGLTNDGDVESYPLLTITGPSTTPTITNTTTGGTLQWDLTLGSGETLVIDMDLRTATYHPSVGPAQSVMYDLVAGWTWWTLGVGSSVIDFWDAYATATLDVTWASAYSSAT